MGIFNFSFCCGETRAELAGLVGPPTAACMPAGMCVLSEEWSKAKLVSRHWISHDVILVTFGLPDSTKPLGLSTCSCILAKFHEDGKDEPIVRPYTPVSTNNLVGQFQLAVKVYPGGKFSQHLKELPLESDVEFKHIGKNVKIQYPFKKNSITMIVGGTSITPMIQALHTILGSPGDTTKVTMLFGNKSQRDILCKDLLDSWVAGCGGRLKVVHVLSEVKDDASWSGEKGYINRELLERHAHPPSEDTLVLVCGPPPMYNAMCGPRDTPELTGILAEMCFKQEQVYKF